MTPDVVIIGHGKTPEGKAWGKFIDMVPTVVRMWNWHWQNPFDYGNKYDYGFYEISAVEMNRFHKHNCRKPERGWVATELHSNVGHKKYFGELVFPTQVVSSENWETIGESLGGMGTKGRLVLSRGVRAACWALEGLQPGQSLALVGFDNVRARVGLPLAEGFPRAFIDCPAGFPFRDYPTDAPVKKYGNHDYQVEGPLLEYIAAKHKVKFVHGQEIW